MHMYRVFRQDFWIYCMYSGFLILENAKFMICIYVKMITTHTELGLIAHRLIAPAA